jgi:hypothetical protein
LPRGHTWASLVIGSYLAELLVAQCGPGVAAGVNVMVLFTGTLTAATSLMTLKVWARQVRVGIVETRYGSS